MNRFRKISTLLLTLALVLTMIPVSAFARPKSQNSEILVYNCQNRPVRVGWSEWEQDEDSGDYDSGEETDASDRDAYFEEDGSYIIPLEDNAFFPYEVEFTCDGETSVAVFESPDSVVSIGGHEIGVSTSYSEDAISQIGFWIDGEYVPAVPDTKTFTDGRARSLLPLDRTRLTLDLSSYTNEQLTAVKVSTILAGIDITDKQVLWNYYPGYENAPEESFHSIGTDPVDMSRGTYDIEMIVGTGHQLDADNLRYVIRVKGPDYPWFRWELSTKESSTDPLLDEGGIRVKGGGVNRIIASIASAYPVSQEYYLNFYGSDDVKIYKGHFDTAADAAASKAEITSVILDSTGYKSKFDTPQQFTFVCEKTNGLILVQKATFEVINVDEMPDLWGIWHQDQQGNRTSVDWNRNYIYNENSNVEIISTTLASGYLPTQKYFLIFEMEGADGENSALPDKAVLGHFNSLKEASSSTDIKDQLFAQDPEQKDAGYLVSFEGSVDLTIFVKEEVYKLTVIAMESASSEDTYFNVTGAKDIGPHSVYRVLDKDDSSAEQFGYQILLTDDPDADLTALVPEFYTRIGIDVFTNGQKQTSGKSVQDFSDGPVQYTARAENGSDVKNYWVSFAKIEKGEAKLYIVVDGQKPGEREVFFDDYLDNHHDIFLANVGDTELTGLKAELKDAVNVKLDPYWNIGGAGNDSLSPFDSSTQNYYDEMSNIAKIRLLANGEGAVSGTLVISSANGGSYTIALKGHAGNPKIITQNLDDAVKYVPYSFLIQTNNKYDWNKAIFMLSSGKLPNGLALRPSGEIYGVPTQTGSFPIKVKAQFTSGEFENSYADLTLKVMQNTDENIASQVSPGYEILDAVPRSMNTVQDQLFRSQGQLSEFIDFWLDGNKLVRGADYTANEGSTAITINAQTFQNHGDGSHTIAAEFRVDGNTNNEMKSAAQNYTLNIGGGSGGSDGGQTNTTVTGNKTNTTQQVTQTVDSSGSSMTIRLQDADLVSLEQLKEMAENARREGKTPWLNVDTITQDRRSVDVRVGINPSLAIQWLYLGGSAGSPQALEIQALFQKHFINQIPAVISLSQQEDFGQAATICVRLPEGSSAENFVIYSYSASSNVYRRVPEPQAWVDANGYLHFKTPYAGNLVLSIGALTKK